MLDERMFCCQRDGMHRGLPIRSISRALDIIKTINRLRSATLTEISNITELPYPTAFRIVQTLIHEGVIEQEPFRKRYRATEMVKSLSSGFQEDDHLVAAANVQMNNFTLRHLWPLALSVRVGNRMMVKHSTHSLTTQTFTNYYPDHTLPLLDCASGRAFLAFCEDEERETLMNGLRVRQSTHKTMTLQLVTKSDILQQIREAGYATMARTQFNATPGKTSAFAIPVFDKGHIKAALSMIFFANAIKMEEAVSLYLSPLQEIAQSVSEKISSSEAASKDERQAYSDNR